MADPSTLAISSMAGTGVQGLLGAFGNLMKGDADASAYQYQAGVARINEQIARGNADYERHVGEINAQREGMKTAQDIGSTKAGQAGSGIAIGSGSSERITNAQLEVGQFDQAMIRSNAARKAYGYEVEATSEDAKARMAGAASDNARKGRVLGAMTSLVSAGGSVASKWLQYGSTFPGANPRDYAGVGMPESGTGGLY